MNTKLYVGNLSFNTDEAGLRAAFETYGSVTDVYVATDRETGRPRGFAFVTFGTEEESKLAAENLNGRELDGRTLTVNPSRPKDVVSSSGRTFSSPNRVAGAFRSRNQRRY